MKPLIYTVLFVILSLVAYRYATFREHTYAPPRHPPKNLLGKTPQAFCLNRCIKRLETWPERLACKAACEAMTYTEGLKICDTLEERCLKKYKLASRCRSEYRDCSMAAKVLLNGRG